MKGSFSIALWYGIHFHANHFRFLEILTNISEIYETSYHILRPSKMFQNIIEYSTIFYNILEVWKRSEYRIKGLDSFDQDCLFSPKTSKWLASADHVTFHQLSCQLVVLEQITKLWNLLSYTNAFRNVLEFHRILYYKLLHSRRFLTRICQFLIKCI